MKSLKITGLFLLLSFTITSCIKAGCIKGNGTIITEERTLVDFDKIEVSGQANVFVTQGATYAVEVTADENVIAHVKTKIHGSTLEVGMEKNRCIRGNTTINVYVTMPTLKGIEVSGSADVMASSTFNTDKLLVDVSGSGNITFANLNANELEMNVSGSGDIEIIGADTLESQFIDISGSGKIKAVNIPCNSANVRVSGSGNLEVYALENLDVNISGSGSVIYKGNPTINSNISGSGDIRPY